MRTADRLFISLFLAFALVTGIAVLMGYTHQLVMFGVSLSVYLVLKWDLNREENKKKNFKRKK